MTTTPAFAYTLGKETLTVYIPDECSTFVLELSRPEICGADYAEQLAMNFDINIYAELPDNERTAVDAFFRSVGFYPFA